ncbi:ATP-binding protein [soil metagenome]
MHLEEITTTFSADPRNLAGIRAFAREGAERLGASVDLEVLAVVVGELAANAVLHQDGQAVVTVRRLDDGALQVEVCDEAPGVPELVEHDTWALGGHRGIQLVAALADEWGVEPEPVGKRVWARLPRLAEV